MDHDAIDAYLRSICSVLDFDIGELWGASREEGKFFCISSHFIKLTHSQNLTEGGKCSMNNLRFKQLYTNPTYEDFHSLLVQPTVTNINCSVNNTSEDSDKHKFSPIICKSVCEGGQIVWANTCIQEGLTGRVELPLNTAVGLPICTVGNDLYIIVLFSVALISPTPAAVEFLFSIAMAVRNGPESGFIKVTDYLAPKIGSFKDLENFFEWDMMQLIDAYSEAVDVTKLQISRLEKFFDCNEILLMCEFYRDFKHQSDRIR